MNIVREISIPGPTSFRRNIGAVRNRFVSLLQRHFSLSSFTDQIKNVYWQYLCRRSHVLLKELATNRTKKFDGNVLVDGMWENPNHWVRYSLFRAAIGVKPSNEIGLTGPHNAKTMKRSFNRLGIQQIYSLLDFMPSRESVCEQARGLIASTTTPNDIFDWELPFDFPGYFVYDAILKKQKTPVVDLNHPDLESLVCEYLQWIIASDRIIIEKKIGLLAMSHVQSPMYGSLVWRALQLGIPVFALKGDFGLCRFVRIKNAYALRNQTCRPYLDDVSQLTKSQSANLIVAGESYLQKRLQGETHDIGADLAFRKAKKSITRKQICEQFNWSEDKPIIAVYTNNWFDFGLIYGLKEYRDFYEWAEITLTAIQQNNEANWLIKKHPYEARYGHQILEKLFDEKKQNHIALVPGEWNNRELQECLDGVITFCGTVGLEMAYQKKPVLAAGEGIYHEFNVALSPRNRAEYVALLNTKWWEDVPVEKARNDAKMVAGWYYCCPDWQEGFILDDDSVQGTAYYRLPRLINSQSKAIEREISEILDWYLSGAEFYHTFKLGRAANFRIPELEQAK